jgi:type IV pilus assembly protein PilB
MSAKILIVDDEKAILHALGQLLTEPEIEVVTANDGEAGLELLGRQRIDLVISDRMMPGMDGVAFLGKVRQLYPELPLMLMTGYSDATLAATMASPFSNIPIVPKPWKSTELRRMVHDALGVSRECREVADLMQVGGLSRAQIDRALRIRQRMQQPKALGEIFVELNELTRIEFDRIQQVRRSQMTVVELLREDGHLSQEDLEAYQVAKQRTAGLSDRALLVDGKLVPEERYLRAVATKHGLQYAEPQVGSIDMNIFAKTSTRYLLRQRVLPMKVAGGRLQVILADPLDNQLIADLERIFGMPIEPVCCASEKIVEALRTLERLRAGKAGGEAGSLTLQYREIEEVSVHDDTGEEAVQIVDYLLARAIQLQASDLHIEPLQDKVRVRVRVDGVLQQLTDIPVEFTPRIVSRVKILAGADIAEKRLHQDGRIFVKIEGREVDIRMSSYVSVHGETLVMRLLDRNRGIVPVPKIGFTSRAYASLTEVVLEASSGLVLVVGPTGSGKTTTLYSFVDHANDPSEKVITAEDPVEYVINGVVQCPVNQKTGPTFEDSLRAIVRQDPDTIVVGEIRDATTVGLALEAALTGHKVFATFHTEDAVGAFVRLLEMGAEPFLVASTVSAIVAQRLVRRLCDKCCKPAEATRQELRFLGLDRTVARRHAFQAGVGCARCNETGYKGRQAIHEVLVPDDDFRDAVMHRAAAKELRKSARRLPEFLTLQEDGVVKAVGGLTSLSEIIANAPRDTAARDLEELLAHNAVPREG